MSSTPKSVAKFFRPLFVLPVMFIGGFMAFSFVPTAAADDCQLYRDDDHVRLDNLVKSRQFPKALDLANALYRHYDECQKSASSDAESRIMNQSWRADTAAIMAQIYRRTNRAQVSSQWISRACEDYRIVVEATIVDTTTRKMANRAIKQNCQH